MELEFKHDGEWHAVEFEGLECYRKFHDIDGGVQKRIISLEAEIRELKSNGFHISESLWPYDINAIISRIRKPDQPGWLYFVPD